MQCPVCGADVVRPQRKYCSRECKLRNEAAQRGHTRHGDGPFECVVCGVAFTKKRTAGRAPTTCSTECAQEKARRGAKKWYHEAVANGTLDQRSRDPDYRRQVWARYYAANREDLIARVLEYQRQNPEKKRAADAKRYALTRGAIGAESFTLDEIYERDHGVCHLCHKRVSRDKASMDHLIPVSLGGPHTRANVSLACRSCNSSKKAEPRGEQLRLIG